MVGRAAIACALTAGFLAGCGSSSPSDMDKTKRMVREKFPGVSQMSTGDLAKWLADPSRPAPVLLDARTAKEFEVSRLAGAKNAPKGTTVEAAMGAAPKDAPVVVYCSVGYRSSQFAEKLQKAGYTKVWNLEGSIFQWANEGRPIVDARGPASLVHPYDAEWGKLLKPERRAQVPDAE